MLETIEKLEKEIQNFRKNVNNSGELVRQLAEIADLLRQHSIDMKKNESTLLSQLTQIPENVVLKNTEILNPTIKDLDDKKNDMLISLAQTRNELDVSRKELTKNYDLFTQQLNSTNLNQVVRSLVEIQQTIKTRSLSFFIAIGVIILLQIVTLFLR